MNMNSEHQGYLKNLIAPGNDPSKKKILLCLYRRCLVDKITISCFPVERNALSRLTFPPLIQWDPAGITKCMECENYTVNIYGKLRFKC